MECVSACVEMVLGPIQAGDGNGEPNVMHGIVLETAPALRDAVCEVRSVFCERPKRARLRDQEPVLKRLVHGAKPARARLKGRLCEFGKHESPCERVCGASRAARRVFCSRNARSESPGRHARAGLHGKPRWFHVRVMSPWISQHESQVSGAQLTWWMARKRAHGAIDGATLRYYVSPERRGGACCKPPPWRRKDGRAMPEYTMPRRDVVNILAPGQRSIS